MYGIGRLAFSVAEIMVAADFCWREEKARVKVATFLAGVLAHPCAFSVFE